MRNKDIPLAVESCVRDFNVTEYPVDLLQIARRAGIKVIKNSEVSDLSEGEYGESLFHDNQWYIVYDDTRPLDKRRFTVALKEEANPFNPARISYDDFKAKYGESIFGGRQPKRALDSLIGRLSEDGYFLKTGVHIFRNKKQSNGFVIQYIETAQPQQMQI